MKLYLNGKYQEVGFWSFMKCSFLVQIALTGIIYAAAFLIALVSIGLGY